MLATGCHWQALPNDLRPKSTMYDYVTVGPGVTRSGDCIMRSSSGPASKPDRGDHRQPEREKCRKRSSRVDLQGYDTGKKVNGKKRHILVDTLGLPLGAVIHPANIQDRSPGLQFFETPHCR